LAAIASESTKTSSDSTMEEGVERMKIRFNKAGEMSIGKIIGTLIFVVVALALLPTIISSVNAGVNASTGTAKTLIPLITIMYVVGVLVGSIMWVIHEVKTE